MRWAPFAVVGERSVLDRLGLEVETLGLVDDLGGDALQRILVGARVVGAEHEFAACFEEHLDVRLSAAAVAAVVCREPGGLRE